MELINAVIKGIASIVGALLYLLPNTPFSWDLGSLSGIWGVANYFIPFAAIISMVITYTTAVALWYAIRWILRITRYIQ